MLDASPAMPTLKRIPALAYQWHLALGLLTGAGALFLGVVVFLASLGTLLASPSQGATRVAILGPADEAAVLETGLSGREGLVVLTRSELGLLMSEQALGSLSTDSPRLGKVIGADVFLSVEDGKPISLRLVDAATGEEMGSKTATHETLVDQAWALLSAARDPTPASLATVAVLDGEEGAPVRAAGTSLREWLSAAGFMVLDRTRTLEVLEERAAREGGFVAGGAELPPFPGASRLLQLNDGEGGIVLTVIASDGTQRGRFVWKSAPQPDDGLQQFLQEQLGDSGGGSMAEFRQRVNVEALLPFYEGVALFDAGRPLEAIVKFQRAYEMNHLFLAAYEWEMRCYEAAGLPEFARAMERWMKTGFSGRGVAAGGDVSARDGITFLGVSEDGAAPSAAATRLALSAMDVLSGPGLLIPASLAAIRAEYDLMAGATQRQGAQWTTSEGFVSRFTLRGKISGEECEWILADDIAGKVLGRAVQSLKGTASNRDAALREILPRLLSETQRPEPVVPVAKLGLPTMEEAKKLYARAATPADRYVAILQMLLLDPGDPVVIGASLRKREAERNQLDSYLDYARRATLLEKLPADHPMRPWLELADIQLFLPSVAAGPHLSGQKRDPQAELKRFSEELPDHPARVLARFLWLTDGQAAMPPAQLAAEARALAPRMRAATEVPQNEMLAKMCDSLEWLGRAAAGEPVTLDPGQTTPRAYRMEITDKAEVILDSNDEWFVEDFRIMPLTTAEIITEARAAIAIGGRAKRNKGVESLWLEDLQGSFSMGSYVGWMGLYHFAMFDGLPHPFPGDYAKLRNHWRKMIEFAGDSLTKWLERAETKEQFQAVDAPLQWFFPALAVGMAFLVEEEEYRQLHDKLSAASAEAARRIGIPDRAPRSQGLYRLDWRDLTLEEARAQGADGLRGAARFMRDIPAFGAALQDAARKAFADEVPSYRDWWRLSNWGLDEAMSNREFATRFVMPFLPDSLRTYGRGPLTDDERAMLLDTAVQLLWGWRFSEAESVLHIVAEAPPATGSDPKLLAALTSLALLNQARLHVQAANRPAAIQTLQRCIEVSEGLEIRNLWRIDDGFRNRIFAVRDQRNNVRSLASRMLEELRFDPDAAVFPERVGAVRIRTRQLDNSEVTVFYRTPPPSAEPPRVLVMIPAFNDGVGELCADASPWARFADAHNLVLVVPQFFHVHTIWKVDHPCAPYHFPQLWAGQVVLDAIDKIGAEHPMDSRRMMLHGFGAGAQFAARFARWRPDRVGALSLHSGSEYPWKAFEHGLQPLPVLKNLPVLLTIGETDDEGVNFVSRRAGTETFMTVLKGMGADVAYHVIDTTFHRETPRLRELAETFLAEQNKP